MVLELMHRAIANQPFDFEQFDSVDRHEGDVPAFVANLPFAT